MKLGILTTHPIQYQAPWFRALAREVDLEVFFAHRPDAAQQGKGFGRAFQWDVDLLSGYQHRFLMNVAKNPSPNRFFGCDTPELYELIDVEGRHPRSQIRGQSAGLQLPISDFSPPPSAPRPPFDAFIVCGWHVKSYWQAARACRWAGVPVFVRGDSQLGTPRSFLKRWAKELLYFRLLQWFDGFLSVGQRNREYLLHYGVPEDRIFFVPHFVDNEWFAEKAEIGTKQKAECRRKWGIAQDAFVPLFVGKFSSKKRPLDLAAAVQIFIAKNAEKTKISAKRPIHLLFVGSGELGPQLRQSCNVAFDKDVSLDNPQPSTLNSQPYARPPASFAGFLNQTELPAAYAAADVLVLPSESETWGLVVNEAMACGLPAIVSDAAGCAPDLVDEGKTGFSFPVGDTQVLAARLVQLQVLYETGHNFRSALNAKLDRYSIQAAVAGTLAALRKTKRAFDGIGVAGAASSRSP